MEQQMKRILSILSCTLAALLIGLGFMGKTAGSRAAKIPGALTMQEHMASYSNGDRVYTPPKENLNYDEAACTIYYDNLLNVYLWSEISDREKEQLAEHVGGIVAGDVSGLLNVLQILVEPMDLAGLQEQADRLMEMETVLYASYEFPMEIEPDSMVAEGDQNPWEGESDRGNEENPSGEDWWAEAIKAYTAWKYEDEIETPVTAGVMDNGFLTGHEEFTDAQGRSKISFPEDFSENVFEFAEDQNGVQKVNSHGTHVAGILAANHNGAGIRGVADRSELVCVDYNNGNQGSNILSSGIYIEATKQMLEEGAKVINNSWGTAIRSEVMFLADLVEYEKPDPLKDLRWGAQWLGNHFTKDYEEYYNRMTGSYSLATSVTCMTMMVQLLCQGREDFLIVQAAGNGYDNGGTGYDVLLGNFYAAVTREHYERYLRPDTRELLEKRGITFDTLRQHILIVAATDKERDDQGRYPLCEFSNYGSNVDLAAPGRDILSCFADHPCAYGKLKGTSMAAPMVSGAAVLVWSVNPGLSAFQVRQMLLDTAGHAVGVTDGDAGKEYRMLNVGDAVERALQEKEKAGRDREEETKGSTGEEPLDTGDDQRDVDIRENVVEPEDPNEAFQTETSAGIYEMSSSLLEYRGKLYYKELRMDAYWHNVRRCNVDGSGHELFFDKSEELNRPYMYSLATEQYIYLMVNHPNRGREAYCLDQFTEDGMWVGSIYVPATGCTYVDGYFYFYDNGYLQRIKAEYGSEPEKLSENYTETSFQIYKGCVYYVTTDGRLMRSRVDGTNPEDISSWLGKDRGVEFYREITNGLFYHDSVYFWVQGEGYHAKELYRLGMDGSEEMVLAPGEGSDETYTSACQVKNLMVFVKNAAEGESICTYNLDTGEIKTILQPGQDGGDSDMKREMLSVPGASRAYYVKYRYEGGRRMDTVHSISLDGSSQVDYGDNILI